MSNIKWISAYNFISCHLILVISQPPTTITHTEPFSIWCYNCFYQSILGKNSHLTPLLLLTASFLPLLFPLNISEGNELSVIRKYLILGTYVQHMQGNYFETRCYSFSLLCWWFCAFFILNISAYKFHIF